MTSLPISRLINVDVVLSPLAAQAQDLSTLLMIGESEVIDVVERMRTYATLAEVATAFGTTSVEYLCAQLYFSQTPKPDFLKIGRMAASDTPAQLICGPLGLDEQDLDLWHAVTTPGFFVLINSIPYNVNPASLATAANLNGVAALIQSGLQADVANSTVIWNAQLARFEVTSGAGVGDGQTISFLQAPTALGNIDFNSSGNPSNGENIVLNGTTVTFVNTTPGANEVAIGLSLADSLANLLEFLNASTDAQIVKFQFSVANNRLYLWATAPGAGGNALTITSTAGTASGATLSGASGTNIAAMMAGDDDEDNGAYIANGIDAETPLDTVALFDERFGQTWYALQMPTVEDDDDNIDVAGYIEGSDNKHIFGITSQDGAVLSPVSSNDIAAELAALGYTRSLVQYSSSNPYAVASFLGRAITTDFNGSATVITMMYKQEPGIVAEALTASQVDALEAKNCNVFVSYNNNTAIVEKGTMASGNFVDEITGTDWLAVTIMTACYNLLYTTTTKIPQTDAGTNLLIATIQAVCSQGVTNGLLAAGVWNASGFGTLRQGDYLPDGFYIYAPPVAQQLQADREARRSVPIQVAAKLAGAIHYVDVTINVNR